MVMTSAFGMEINSNDIRVVIHAEAPMSMSIQSHLESRTLLTDS
ncbi:6601_t:CDS:2, partial [Rhizophagus irregularis]